MKDLNSPGSGKEIAEGKGVRRESESEGSRMTGNELTGRANLRPDEQEPHTRSRMRVRLPNKLKPDSCTESCGINVAGRWRERNVWYPGRSARNALRGVTAAARRR